MIGLGGSGLAAIDEALAGGASVVGIDAGAVGGGAAGRNGGFLLAGSALFHHDAVERWGEERANAIYAETLAEIDRMEAELGPRIVRRCGVLRLPDGRDEADDCARQREALLRGGFEAEAVERDGLLVPTDGAVDPLARCRVYAERAIARGARLFTGTPAEDVSAGRVESRSGRVLCGAVVVAVDGGLETLLPELGDRVRSTRLQMLGTAPLPLLWPRPVYHRWGYDYWQQLRDGRVVAGGFRDRHARAEWGAAAETGAAVQADLEDLLRERVGFPQARITHRWAGVVSYTDDALPVLEEVRSGVFACGAYCGHGNVLGAVCGRAAARMALGRPPAPITTLLKAGVPAA